MTSSSAEGDKHEVPRVSFGSDEPDDETQTESERELQEENAETSLDQPST